ncbi:hypothetical protein EVG20_g6248 [Dentipellis fragilis]|uniref:Uncharacterized protein n=1 Tax=Dentipellis fragilis TaxID=205917 RepID=A0A4Y9YP41_9AGAM|nr:hypothetical protein EVG20_g6248 [Dentipellis fragilis]
MSRHYKIPARSALVPVLNIVLNSDESQPKTNLNTRHARCPGLTTLGSLDLAPLDFLDISDSPYRFAPHAQGFFYSATPQTLSHIEGIDRRKSMLFELTRLECTPKLVD